MNFTGISHIGIIVPDLADAAALYTRRLGVTPGPMLENAGQNVRMLHFDLGNARIELLSPIERSGPLAEFLKLHPKGGLHHLSLATEDLELALREMEADEVRPIAPPGRNLFGNRFAFIHPRFMCGVLLEVEEQPD